MRTPLDDLPPAFAARPTATAARNATILLLTALTIMAGATISPALPAIEAHFADSAHAPILTRLILTMPALFIAVCAPVAGVLADRYGRRPVAIAAVVLYGLAGMSGLIADSLPGLLVGRALLGVAVAGVMTVATALVGDFFTGPARERFMGLQAAFIGIGGLFFLTGGGLLAEFHWRAPFLIYVVAFGLCRPSCSSSPSRSARRIRKRRLSGRFRCQSSRCRSWRSCWRRSSTASCSI